MDDKEKVAEIIRLLEELKFQEKIVLGYTDKEMIELFRGKVKEIRFINRVPIVPIIQFSSFIDEFYGNLEEIKTIEK